jgi:hypothetical protein
MPTPSETLIELETRFWQSLVDQDIDSALELLSEPAISVSGHGAIKFDRKGYRQMADHGPVVVKSFVFSDMDVVFPNESTAVLAYRVKQEISPRDGGGSTLQEMNDTSTWIRKGGRWECVMHTETPRS